MPWKSLHILTATNIYKYLMISFVRIKMGVGPWGSGKYFIGHDSKKRALQLYIWHLILNPGNSCPFLFGCSTSLSSWGCCFLDNCSLPYQNIELTFLKVPLNAHFSLNHINLKTNKPKMRNSSRKTNNINSQLIALHFREFFSVVNWLLSWGNAYDWMWDPFPSCLVSPKSGCLFAGIE
jgi:hypothetical protein